MAAIQTSPSESKKHQGSQLTLHELHVFRAAHFDGQVHVVSWPAPETEHGNLALSVMPIVLVVFVVHVKPGEMTIHDALKMGN